MRVSVRAGHRISGGRTRPRLRLRLRGGNHQKQGVAMGETALRIAIRAVQPEMQPYFGFGTFVHICGKHSHKWPKTGPNRRRTVRSGVLRGPNCVTCAPDEL